jgi:hypothetical protein
MLSRFLSTYRQIPPAVWEEDETTPETGGPVGVSARSVMLSSFFQQVGFFPLLPQRPVSLQDF